MVINIPPGRINTPSGAASRSAGRLPPRPSDSGTHAPPRRSAINHIPSPESLRTLVSNAIDALRRGVYWDRGTILNLLV